MPISKNKRKNGKVKKMEQNKTNRKDELEELKRTVQMIYHTVQTQDSILAGVYTLIEEQITCPEIREEEIKSSPEQTVPGYSHIVGNYYYDEESKLVSIKPIHMDYNLSGQEKNSWTFEKDEDIISVTADNRNSATSGLRKILFDRLQDVTQKDKASLELVGDLEKIVGEESANTD